MAGRGPAPKSRVRIRQPGIEVIRDVDTGVMRVEVSGVELAMVLEQRRRDGRVEVREREPFAGIIEDYYLEQREAWRWYGFLHYGDFMHTYDPQRHVWHYDQGGRAWDSTELGADLWPWYSFLRTGRADWFRFAEAMTRHVSEVDVYHAGPLRLLQGDPFDYDPVTGAMTPSQEYAVFNNRLALTMGGAEALMEMADTLSHAGLREALAEFGACHGLDPVRERSKFPPGVYERISGFQMNARLVAWAGRERGDRKLLRRAWELWWRGDNDPREPKTRVIPHRFAPAPPQLSAEPRRDSDLGTNQAATISLNIIAGLALAPRELPGEWRCDKTTR